MNCFGNLHEVLYPKVPKRNMKDIADFAGRLLTISDTSLFDPLGQPVKEQHGFEIPSDYLTPAQAIELDHDKFFHL
jgi:hypothetical protein